MGNVTPVNKATHISKQSNDRVETQELIRTLVKQSYTTLHRITAITKPSTWMFLFQSQWPG